MAWYWYVAGVALLLAVFRAWKARRARRSAESAVPGSHDGVTLCGLDAEPVARSRDGLVVMNDRSPFVEKVTTVLRFLGQPFDKKGVIPAYMPQGKVPVLRLFGEVVCDSDAIVRQLQQHLGRSLDTEAGLTRAQRATSRAFVSLLEQSFYWETLYFVFQTPEGWSRTKHRMRSSLPPIVNLIVPMLVHRSILQGLQAQGYGRHERSVVATKMNDDLTAVNDLLLSNTPADCAPGRHFFFGNQKPCLLDAIAYSFLVPFAMDPDTSVPCPELQAVPHRYPALVAFVRHVVAFMERAQRQERRNSLEFRGSPVRGSPMGSPVAQRQGLMH